MPDLLKLGLLIAVLLPAGKLAATLGSRIGIPAIIGELMVGIVAGPGGWDLLHRGPFHGGEATNAFMLMAQLGGLVLMFMAGLETDIEGMREAGGTAFLVALSGVIWPFVLGAGAAHLLGLGWSAALFVGGALTATSVSISARTLMDGGHMASKEATIILGAAIIDDVMGLFVLAFLTATLATGSGESFGAAPAAALWLERHLGFAAQHPLVIQMTLISASVATFFLIGHGAAKRWLDPLILHMRKLTPNESVTSCVFALMLVYAFCAEWMGSVAGITGAYLLGYVFAGSKYKADVEQTFHAIGHGVFIPLFFVSIGLTSNFRALGGHWTMLAVIFVLAVITKMVGCGAAAMAGGMGAVSSLRVGCGMVSRGEVGLIIAAMAIRARVFDQSQVAMIVAVVLLTTLVTPLALRAAFHLKSHEDDRGLPGAQPANELSLAEDGTTGAENPGKQPQSVPIIPSPDLNLMVSGDLA